jgi:8-amino-7-oxononanoate synthase
MKSLDAFADATLADAQRRGLHRSPPVTVRERGLWVVRDGRRLLSFCSNDYLGLGDHPAVIAAAAEALGRYGAGAGASYLITGRHPLYAELEARLAAFKGTDDAIVFGSGFLANAGIAGALMRREDLVLIDELAHASMWAGSRLAQASVRTFAHNDLDALAALLRAHRAAHPCVLILTEGVFSMDGDLAPLPALAALAEEFDAWLLCDDAHGLGVIGAGRGAAFAHARPARIPLQVGTLSKAAGSYGGYLCASRPVIDLVKNRARTFVYTTSLPPATVAASIAALDIIAADAQLTARPLALAQRFAARLRVPAPQSAIVSLVLGDARATVAAQLALEADGFLVVAIRPPTVPAGTSRLRVTFSALHTEAEADALADALAPLWARYAPDEKAAEVKVSGESEAGNCMSTKR